MGFWNWVFENWVYAQASERPLVARDELRSFRTQVAGRFGKSHWRDEGQSFEFAGDTQAQRRFARNRRLISEIRSHVYYDQPSIFSDQKPYDTRIVARVLGLASPAPVRPSIGFRIRLFFFSLLAPSPALLNVATKLMRTARTHEGRRLLYDSVVRRLIGNPGHGICVSAYLSQELDFLIRRFSGFSSFQVLFDLERRPIELLKAAYLMGARTAPELSNLVELLAEGDNPAAVLILAEAGIVSVGHPSLRAFAPTGYPLNNLEDRSDRDDLRATVRILIENEVALTDLLWLIGCRDRFDANALALRIEILRSHGVNDISTVFGKVRAKLWTTELDVLMFALIEMRVLDALHISRLSSFFSLYAAPNPTVTRALLKHGATQDDMVRCQDLIKECKDLSRDCAPRIGLLLSRNLSFADLNKCSSYLRLETYGTDRFQQFFDTLGKFNLQTPEALLAFQPSFQHFGTEQSLALRLKIASKHVPEMPLAVLAKWVERSHVVRYDSLQYLGLESGIPLGGVELLEKALRLCVVSEDLLRFLVVECDKKSIAALVNWYYEIGTNASAYSGRGNYDQSTRALFRDCMERRSFLHLSGNASALAKACCDYASAHAGQWDWSWTEQKKETHRRERDAHYGVALVKSEPYITEILNSTGGVLFSSTLLLALNGENYQASLLSLRPWIESLILGQGPRGDDLSQLEIEALCMAYGVHAEDVVRLWPKVIGREWHVEQLAVATSYDVTLVQDSYELGKFSSAYADSISTALESIALSAAMAKGVVAGGIVSLDLRRKHLVNPAATPRELWKWFGLLLGITANHEQVRPWIERSLEEMRGLLHKGGKIAELLESFRDFIAATLNDAIEQLVGQFIHSLTEADIRYLTQLLAPLSPPGQDVGDMNLEDQIRRLSLRVQTVYCRWADTVRNRVVQRSSANELRALAVLTKSPAAFFSRFSFGLCTSNNTSMWDEERYLHLLIFDPKRLRLLGMAMIYVQPIDAHFEGRQCLIVRALNTRAIDGVTINATSFIDAVFCVAAQIARANGLAAVLYPRSSTYFSNQHEIERSMRSANFTKDSRKIGAKARERLFYCEEFGAKNGAVDELYVSWNDESAELVCAN